MSLEERFGFADCARAERRSEGITSVCNLAPALKGEKIGARGGMSNGGDSGGFGTSPGGNKSPGEPPLSLEVDILGGRSVHP